MGLKSCPIYILPLPRFAFKVDCIQVGTQGERHFESISERALGVVHFIVGHHPGIAKVGFKIDFKKLNCLIQKTRLKPRCQGFWK